jgi:hypothetical protein
MLDAQRRDDAGRDHGQRQADAEADDEREAQAGFDAFARQAPYASAALIVLVGLYTGWLGWQGISQCEAVR